MSKNTELFTAVYFGDLEKVETLVRSGLDLAATNKYGRNALMDAVMYFRPKLAKFLVGKMTANDLMAVDQHGFNVLHIMAIEEVPWPAVMTDISDKCPETLQQLNPRNRRPIDVAKDMQCKDQGLRRDICDILSLLEERQQQKKQQQQYVAGIAKNVENPCNITITVVGHHGVGKSCFVQQLKEEYIPEGGPGSTDTANFYVNYLGYNPNTGFRRKLDENGEIETGRQRLKRIIDRYRKEEENDTVRPSSDTCTSNDHDDKEELSASTLDLNETSASTPDLQDDTEDSSATLHVSAADALVLPSRIRTGTRIKQKMQQLFSKLPFRRKRKKEVQEQEILHNQSSGSSSSSEAEYEAIPQMQSGEQASSEQNVLKEIPIEQKNVIDAIMHTETGGDTEKDVEGFVTIYDFGGEKVFYNTHHCFMSSNMIFVLVFDVAMCLDPDRQKDGYERIEFWLRAIATYAMERAEHGKGSPPIILVGSHLDLLSQDKEEQQHLFASVLEKLNKKPELRDIIKTHVQEMFPIADLNDSTKNQATYQKMWEKIIEIAPLQSQWMKPVPARWVAFEHELVRLKNDGRVILTYADLLEINRELAVPLVEDDIMEFIWKLKFSGSFLCFDLHNKRPFIVLQAQWIINAFKAIITDPKFTTKLTVKQVLEWTAYTKSGVLTLEFIRQLWGRYKELRFLEEEETLFIALETLGLLSKPLSVDVEVNYFIVPSILQTADPEVMRPVLDDPDTVTSVALCIKFDNPFIPQAVWDKMIAACIHRFQRHEEPDQDDSSFIQRGFACLQVKSLWKMIITCKDNAMKIIMFTRSKDQKVLLPGTGISLRKIMKSILLRILQMNNQGHLDFHFYLHNDYRFGSNDRMVRLEDLYERESVECCGSDGTGWIHRKDMYVWFEDENQKVEQTQQRSAEETKHLPDRNPSFKEVGRLSRYIRSSYLTFFVDLDCPEEVVEQEMEEHRHLAFRSRITKVFLHLLKMKGDVSFEAIADAMSNHGMDSAKLINILDTECKVDSVYDSLLQQCLSLEIAHTIADHIDIKTYFNLFLELGFPPAKVDDFDDEYRNKRIRVQVTAMLEEFITNTVPCPTVDTILLAMQECDMDTKPLIAAIKPR